LRATRSGTRSVALGRAPSVAGRRALGEIVVIISTLIQYPWTAFVLAAGFAGLWIWQRALSAAVAGILLVLYGIYEYLMYLRVLCSGECNIRVDLLLIYPILLIATITGAVQTARRAARRARL
jgi:hypothetical protein